MEGLSALLRPLGIGLSALTLLLLAALLLGLRRRGGRFRPWRLGAVTLRPAGLRRAWAAILLGGFLAGLYGVPLATRTATAAGDEGTPGSAGRVLRTTSTLRLPFYVRHVREERSAGGRSYGRRTAETLQLPWEFLVAVLLYGLFRARGPRDRGGETAGGATDAREDGSLEDKERRSG